MSVYGDKSKATNLSELPVEIQTALRDERILLHSTWKRNDSYNVCFTDKDGTRFFTATRKCIPSYVTDRPFGGGSYWVVRYGKILWSSKPSPLGTIMYEYYWKKGSCFNKAKNGTEIPNMVATKKEVLALAKAIGIFEM